MDEAVPRTRSMRSDRDRERRRSPFTVLAVGALMVAVAVAAGTIAIRWPDANDKRLTAYFERAVGLYPQSHVRVLGVTVGHVSAVTPLGDRVRVEMVYEADRKIPADAEAVILSPSLASDRYVQLAPVYRGGPALEDGAVLPTSRTAAPVEIDQVFASINDLTSALGPGGANRDGSLSRLLQVGSDNLRGQGDNLRETTENLADAASTLRAGRTDLFGTVENLQTFATALAEADRQVRALNADLAAVSTQLDGEREELAAALRNLSTALEEVTEFVRTNRGELTDGVEDLATVSAVLVRQQDALAEILDTGPLQVANAWQAFDPTSQALSFRLNAEQVRDPAMFICSLLYSLGVPPSQCEPLLAPLDALAPDALPLGIDPSVIPFLTGNPDIGPPPPEARGHGDTSARGPAPGSAPGTSAPDPTLGGILAPPRQP